MVLIGSPDGKRPPGGAGSGIKDNSKIDIKETVWQSVNWIRVI
jgi:hypothetical protein